MNADDLNALIESAYETFLKESRLDELDPSPVDGIIRDVFKAGFVFGARAGFDKVKDAVVNEIAGRILKNMPEHVETL